MAATVTLDMPRALELQDSGGGRKRLMMLSGTIAVSETYATGGVSVGTDISKYFKTLKRVVLSGGPYSPVYNASTAKVLLYGDNVTAATGALIEPNTVAVTQTIDFIAIGF